MGSGGGGGGGGWRGEMSFPVFSNLRETCRKSSMLRTTVTRA